MIKKFIKEFLRANRIKYILGIAALICSGVLTLTMPKMLGYIIDCLKMRNVTQTWIYQMTGVMLGMAMLIFGLKYIWRNLLMGRARDLECYLRDKLFSHLQTLPVSFYQQKKTGDLMAYAINDLGAVRRAFAFGLVFPIDGVIINSFSLLVMARTINPRLTLIGLAPLSVALFLIFEVKNPLRRDFLKVQAAYANISEKTQENISGIRVVKAYVQEEQEIRKLGEASSHRMKVMMDYIKLSSIVGPAVQICFGLSFSLVLVIGSSYVISGAISLGDFIAFNTYLGMLTRPVTRIGKVVEVWQRALASMNRLDEIFTSQTDIIDGNLQLSDSRFKGAIQIKNLNFSYPNTTLEALKDINLKIEAGKTLAIIGRTGSGKSTLINLLLRLYPVERGHIFIDGIDINDLPLAILRGNIGFVPQDNFLFSATIKDNIRFFTNHFTEEEVEEAAKFSSVYDNIMDFPAGFETKVGERGITLSGGQKQRVSIARAIIKNPSILILDDSLSAVDTKTEEEILSNIKKLLKERTGIIIAHRVSTIKHADQIIVLEDGRIIEEGNHQELMKQKGYYYKLYSTQLVENRLEEVGDIV